MKIYVDLDSVLVDLMKEICKIGGVRLNRHWNFDDRPEIWEKIKEKGSKFWKELPWMPDGKELWDGIKKYDPIVLSAPTREYSSVVGKKSWIKKNIPGTKGIIEYHKYKYAKPGDILIDDRIKNTSKWEEHGGTAILHKNTKDTLKQLKKILSRKKKASDYAQYLSYTPKDGGEYYVFHIPEGIDPPDLGATLKIGSQPIVVVDVKTPLDIAKGRGGPVARSLEQNGIAYSVNCLPEGHERLADIREFWDRQAVTKIKPYDALVSEVVREMGQELKGVDVIVLEPTCTGNTHGYVHNQDLLMSRPGEEKIIHLCLPQIKADFRKQFQSNYNMGNINDQKKMKEMLKEYLRGVVLPHEMVHIQQELEHGGEFGPSPETQAEKAEDWSVMAPYGITKRASLKDIRTNENNPQLLFLEDLMVKKASVISLIDKMANNLESQGYIKEAYDLDIVANTMEKEAFIDQYWANVVEWMTKNAPVNFSDLKKWMDKGFQGMYKTDVKDKSKEWEKVLSLATPEHLRHIAQTAGAAGIDQWRLVALTMPIEKWAQYTQLSPEEFIGLLGNKSAVSPAL